MKALLLLLSLLSTGYLFAEMDGYDYQLTKNHVILEKDCFKINWEMSMYDYEYGDYHHISIEDVECVNKGCEVKIFDWTLKEYRFIEMQKDMCPEMR